MEDETERSAGAAEIVDEQFPLLELLTVLSRRKRVIAATTLAVALVTALVVFLLPNEFTAAALLVPPAPNSAANLALSQMSTMPVASMLGLAGSKHPAETYIALLRSRTVEDRLIQRFGLLGRYRCTTMLRARREFEIRSRATLGSKDNLIRLEVQDRDPKVAAELTNAWVEELQRATSSLALSEASQRRQFFAQQVQEVRANLNESEEALKKTEQTTGILQVDSQARALVESAAELRAQVVAKKVQVESMRVYATEDNPRLKLARQQLQALEAQQAQLAGANSGSGTADVIVPRGKIPQAGLEYMRGLRDVKYYETVSELLAKQLELAKLDEARQGASIQVADRAVAPEKKSSPQRAEAVALMTLATFVGSCLGCVVWENWQKRVETAEGRQRLAGLCQAWRT